MANEKQQNVGLDFKSLSKVIGLQAAESAGGSVEYSQWVTANDTKQDNVSGGQGISMDGDSINIDLVTSGNDYGTMTVSDTGFGSLNGVYSRLDYSCELEYSGTNLDLKIGDSSIDWNGYYKYNGSGVWAVIMKRDTDGSEATAPEGGSWLAVLTTTDPESLSYSGAGFIISSSFIPNYQAVDHDFITYSNESSGDSKFSPSSADSQILYNVGSSPAGLRIENDKLGIDFANQTNEASSTKVFPSSIVLQYIDEQIVDAKDLSNHPFSNVVAQISGNPTNAQSMGEALASEIDDNDAAISNLQTKDTVHDAYLADHTTLLGVGQGEDTFGTFSEAGTSVIFLSNTSSPGVVPTNAKAGFVNISTRISEIYTNMGTTLGLDAQVTDFGTGFIILPNNSDAKSLFQATELELQNLSQGLGQFWAPVDVHSDVDVDISNPGTDVFGGSVASQGDRVLLLGQTSGLENGIYIFDTTSTAMVRSDDANEPDEFSPNKTVQVLRSTEDGISGATFSYTGVDAPTLDSIALSFVLKSKGVVGEGSVTESKLETTLANKLNAKTDKWADNVVLTGGVWNDVVHSLGDSDITYSIKGDTGEFENYAVREKAGSEATTIQIFSSNSETVRVVVIA